MSAAVEPGRTLGVMGGGQLGRMFVQAAQRMGYAVHVYSPESGSPAGQVANLEVCGEYTDQGALEAFAREVDVVTFEFENIPVEALAVVEEHAPVRPNARLLGATQERLREKSALSRLGLPVATHAAIVCVDDLAGAAAAVGFPAILKTSECGYDGKGQVRVQAESELADAWIALGQSRSVLEQLVPFVSEISVVAARGLDGAIAIYEPFLNHHTNHILDVTSVPAPIAPATVAAANEIARGVLEGFDVVGVLCVEMFLLADGSLILNEVAPRTHNSGHITIDAHETSQFEQQVRAICGLPLGSVERRGPAAAMVNLLGDLWGSTEPPWEAVLEDRDLSLHLYGKAHPRPGRKMGHLVVTGPCLADVQERAGRARAQLQTP